MFRSTLVALCAGLLSFTSAQNPIPTRPDGFPLGGPQNTAPVVLEAFFDLMCPDSRASWPALQEVIAHYGEKLHFRLHTFPLPYHTWSHVANTGAHFLGDNNATAAVAWTNAVFANQEAFGNAATAGLTRTEVIANFAALADKEGLSSVSLMTAGLNDPVQDYNTRVSWKYGCSRSITGTPQFLVNGVQVQADPTWTAANWESVLDYLFQTPASAASAASAASESSSSSSSSKHGHGHAHHPHHKRS